MGIFAFILNWLGGGVLKTVLGHLEERKRLELGDKKVQAEVTIEEIKAELARRNAQKEVLLKESESSIQWLPRFTFGMTAALYYLAVNIDSIWDLPGTVLTLPDNEAGIMKVIVAGLFLEGGARAAATKIAGALRK